MTHRIIKLGQMTAVTFEGIGPECEMEAFGKMKEWLEGQPVRQYRVFGYNTDSEGNLTVEPQHEGYKVLVVREDHDAGLKGLKTEVISPGRFLVIRAEGELGNIMEWLPAGWMNLNKAVQENNLKVKVPPRWYEEHIRTDSPDYMIVDLYLELE